MRRELIVLTGSADQTRAEAARLLAAIPEEEVLWAGRPDRSLRQVRALLGRSFEACVVSFHGGVDADLLGQCHGFVVGGGTFIVRADPGAGSYPGLAALGHDVGDVTTHFPERLSRTLAPVASSPRLVERPSPRLSGTDDQARLVEALGELFTTRDVGVVTADRGRGKSAALGLALRNYRGRVGLTAASEESVREVVRFAGEATVEFRFAPELLSADAAFDLLVVDEAAQLPVPLLRELTTRFLDTTIVFATTVHGYEGTGRGFALKFVPWLERQRTVHRYSLRQPIRWAPDDPVESAVFEALLLDAEPLTPPDGTVTHREVPRAELAQDEQLLREIFGLLVQAHYRTTPSDLHRMLDAPNLSVHASFIESTVVAATLVAQEGGLGEDVAEALAKGETRIVGHALPDTFAAHMGRPDLARLRMVRSVRIATHPELRRNGIARGLVEHVHAQYEPDLFGTLFGAEVGLLRFRRALGYELVRLSASRGRRTGAPSVVMIRPVSARAREAFAELRQELARDLGRQLELHSSDGALRLGAELGSSLLAELGPVEERTSEAAMEIVRSYAFGPRTFESAATAVTDFLVPRLDEVDPAMRELVVARAIERRGWLEAAKAAKIRSIPAAMRALRRVVRTLVEP